MLLLRTVRRSLAYLWHGPADLPPSLKLEWRIVFVTWLGIALFAPSLLVLQISPERRLAAYGVLVVACIYNAAAQVLLRRRSGFFASGYVTTLVDGLLGLAMMVSLGVGFDSPFSYFFVTLTVVVAMRSGYGPSLALVAFLIGVDLVEDLATSLPAGQGLDERFIFRAIFLGLTAILASYLREQAREAEAALQERLRQANLLNEATASIAASLELQPVLHDVLAGASRLLGSECAVLLPSEALIDADPDSVGDQPIVFPPAAPPTELQRALVAVCRRYAGQEHALAAPGDIVGRGPLPRGQEAVVLVLVRPERQVSLGAIALAVAPQRPWPLVAPDLVRSFVERTSLAIENAALYRSLTSRSKDLQRAYADLAMAHQELLSVDEMKTNFLANVSHELRTPLTSIRAFSELLLSYADANVQEEFLQIINAESERLTRLVNDVLDVTKIESGNMEWHMAPVDLVAVLRESARSYAPLIKRQNLAFRTEISAGLPPVQGDRDRIQQVIGNLLGNAMKFTPSGSIRLGARLVDSEVWVYVADTGIGVAPDDRQRIFEKFQQVGAMLTDKPKGTGLGLAICREIIAHHGGRLWVDSELGAGSTFTFSLRVVASAAARPSQDARSAIAGAPPDAGSADARAPQAGGDGTVAAGEAIPALPASPKLDA